MNKKLNLLFGLLIGFLIVSCSKDENNSNSKNDLNNGEFVVLIPYSVPINTIEINNEVYVFYNDDLAYDGGIYGERNKLSKVGSSGIIQWTKEIPLTNFPDLSIVTSYDNQINLFYQYNGEFNQMIFDLEGNYISTKLIQTGYFNSIQKNNSDFHISRAYNKDIIVNTYSFSGSLLKSDNLQSNLTLAQPETKIVVKNNTIYSFSSIWGGGNTSNFTCEVFQNNESTNTISKNGIVENIQIQNSLVLNNENILIVSINDYVYTFEVLSLNGSVIASKIFKSSSNIMKVFLTSNGNIGFVGGYNRPSNNYKWSEITILDPMLNVLTQRILGSYDEGEIFFDVKEANNYYVTGTTFGRNGDFDFPNNSTGVDMFLYRLNK